jgi:uncharacterized Zn finger protein
MRRYYHDDDDEDNYYGYYKPSKPRHVEDGIKAKTKRGQSFGSTWWSKKWIEVLESFGWENRLQRGRSYARKGQVIDIDIKKGKVGSHVQGSRSTPYKIDIEMKQILDKDWDNALDAMSEQAIFAAKLLAGEMPNDIEDAFNSAKISLFPMKKDINTTCSCPDFANPCKHIAAVYYLLGERFDEDPFLIFLLRGRSKEEIMELLRSRRSAIDQTSEENDEDEMGVASAVIVESLELANDQSFWELKSPIDDLRVSINPPNVEMAIIKRLGELPFWTAQKRFSDFIKPIYSAVSKKRVISDDLDNIARQSR